MHRLLANTSRFLTAIRWSSLLRHSVVCYFCLAIMGQSWTWVASTLQATPQVPEISWVNVVQADTDEAVSEDDSQSLADSQILDEDADDFHVAFGRERPEHFTAVSYVMAHPEWRCQTAPQELRPPIVV